MGQNTRSTLVNVFDEVYNRDTLRCLRFRFTFTTNTSLKRHDFALSSRLNASHWLIV